MAEQVCCASMSRGYQAVVRAFVLSLLLASGAWGSLSPEDFQRWVQAGVRGEDVLDGQQRDAARRLRYIFVAGIGNELVPSSFRENARTLRELGVPSSSIHILRPSSLRSVEENSAWLRSRMEELVSLGSEPLVVAGHSKGAAEVLAFALMAEPRLQDRLAALYLVQGPMHGSPLADHFYGEGVAIDERLSWFLRRSFRWMTEARLSERIRCLDKLAGGRVDGGLASLTRRAIESLWSKLDATFPGSAQRLSSRVYYLQAWEEPTRLPFLLAPGGRYLAAYHGPNDGILPLSTQSREDLGTVLARFQLAHPTLVTTTPRHASARKLRAAVTRAMVKGALTAFPPPPHGSPRVAGLD